VLLLPLADFHPKEQVRRPLAMARKRKAPVDELEELEDELEDLDEDDEEDEDVEEDDDLEDEEEDDEDEDDDEDEEEAPKSKKKSKTKKKKPREDGKVGSAELAEALGTDGRNLRVMLRDHNVEKNPENNRYEWDSINAALKAIGFKNVAAAKKALVESRQQRLDELKERVADKRGKTKSGTKKKTSKK
jgi:hypothetical protein